MEQQWSDFSICWVSRAQCRVHLINLVEDMILRLRDSASGNKKSRGSLKCVLFWSFSEKLINRLKPRTCTGQK